MLHLYRLKGWIAQVVEHWYVTPKGWIAQVVEHWYVTPKGWIAQVVEFWYVYPEVSSLSPSSVTFSQLF